ncbi:MAG: AMP-binding protein, partial [Pseudomonadota bacterium]
MSHETVYEIPRQIAANALIDETKYREMYARSISDPEQFWAEQAEKFLTWSKPWRNVMDYDFRKGHIRWFEEGMLNVSYNCLDRHLETRGDQTAILWEGDNPAVDKKITYRELHQQVCKFANVLKSLGVNKGDRVCIYMPMIPEAAVSMLACTRIGAVHSVVFGGFSADALKDRIIDSDCRYLVCADEGIRGGKHVPLKTNTDKAVGQCPNLKHIIVVKNTGGAIEWNQDRDLWYHEYMAAASSECPAEEMDAEDPLFILYTSGSTGKPKGV